MLALYTFVFGFVFKLRLPGAESTLAYVTWLISGYGTWIATSEALLAASTSVVSAASLVKNVAFKTELLPIAGAFTGLVPLAVSLAFLLVLLVAQGRWPGAHVAWIPVIVCTQFLLILGLGLWLSAVNVFMRDLSFALPNLLTIVLFATPIFYPIDQLPRAMQQVSLANPFYQLAEAYRGVLLEQRTPDLAGLAFVLLLACGLFGAGLVAFRRARRFFEAAL
jgi:lipopolysaccharide transport system permease protein